MDLLTIAQVANPILQLIFIVVIGFGYYYSVRSTQGEPGLMFEGAKRFGLDILLIVAGGAYPSWCSSKLLSIGERL